MDLLNRSNFYTYNYRLIKIPYGSLFEISGKEDIIKKIFEYLLLSTTRKDQNPICLTSKNFYKWAQDINPYRIIKDIFSTEKREMNLGAIIFGKLEYYPKELTNTLDTKFIFNCNAKGNNDSFENFKKECFLTYPVNLDHVKNEEKIEKLINNMKENLDYLSKKNLLDFNNLIIEKNKEFFLFLNRLSDDIDSAFEKYPKLNIEESEKNQVFFRFTAEYQGIVTLLIQCFNESPLDNDLEFILKRSISTLILLRSALIEKHPDRSNPFARDSWQGLDTTLEAQAGCDILELASKFKIDSLKSKLLDSEGFLLSYFHKKRHMFAKNIPMISDRILNNTEFCLNFFKEDSSDSDFRWYESMNQTRLLLFNRIIDKSIADKKIIIEYCKKLILNEQHIIYKKVPDILKKDIECILHCIKKYNENKKQYNRVVSEIIEYCGKWGWPELHLLSEELKQNPQIFNACTEILLKDVKKGRCNKSLIPYEFFSNRKFILAYIARYPENLEKLSNELKDNKEVVLAAVESEGTAIKFASNNLKNNPEIALAAIKNDKESYSNISEELKKNRKFVTDIVQWKGHMLKYFIDNCKDDEEIVRIAIANIPSAYLYASKRVRNIPEIAAFTVVLDKSMRNHIPKELQENKTFIKAKAVEKKNLLLSQNNNLSQKRKLPSNSTSPPNTKKQKINK